ncbi:MAG: J domain-containing protein [Anaerolineae bacterium]|jgi:curved DNA-binding protein
MEYKDYYRILGVDKKASEKEIKKAFRRLARQHHPDMNPDDPQAEERFKEINEAHEVLSDPEKRAKYDQLGADWQRWQQRGGRPGDFDWSQWTAGRPGERVHVRYGTPEDLEDLFGGGSPFSDFFSQIFGGMSGSPGRGGFQQQMRPQRGQDYEQPVEITLQEAYQGTARILQKDGQRLEVKIPAGARTGTRVRMSGHGGVGAAGGPAGNLYLRVTVLPDARFERDGENLRTTVPVDLITMILGGQVRVPTMTGDVVLTIPPGTQNGRTFRLRGKGMPHLQQPDRYGDLYARVEVQLPTKLTREQRKLFEQLRDLGEA